MNFSLFCVSKHHVNSCYHMVIDGLQDTVWVPTVHHPAAIASTATQPSGCFSSTAPPPRLHTKHTVVHPRPFGCLSYLYI